MKWLTLTSLPIVASALAVSACSTEMEDDYVSKAPAATVLGEGVNCVTTSRIDNTRVHDDRTIDFEMDGGKVYRNTLPRSCPQLGFEERFAYRTTTSQLCSVDTITVLYGNGSRGATCGLGPFVPVEVLKE